ncbi:hypothetical protein PoB_001189600 [Plakobranchus ocellatus]|uniref:Uncharacterized protein n=1 Tax=Plakobranchus ocellatus TaxID=259542 RepID=A0AAV3YSL4_9GAST|nr:hypothetical protein PoB_001189600 [Plakobranchus ocellatus]
MADNSHRRASSPLINTCIPPPILEDEEDEEVAESSKTIPPNNLPVPQGAHSASSSQDLYSPQFLCVDESKRPRAHSDPSVTVGGFANYILPEITVTEDDEGNDASLSFANSRGIHHLFLKEPMDSIRKRSNTCPEDLFRPSRKGRPATPPPTDVVPVLAGKRRAHSAGGVRRFSFNIAPPPVALKSPTSVSFAHHKLSKVSEDLGSESPPPSTKRETEGLPIKATSNIQHSVPQRIPDLQAAPILLETLENSKCSGSTAGSLTCTEPSKNYSPHLQGSVKQEHRHDKNINVTDNPLKAEAMSLTQDCMNINGTPTASKCLKENMSSCKATVPRPEKASTVLSTSLGKLSVADKQSHESSSPKASESASGISKSSLPSWRASDKKSNGNLAAF